MRKIRNVFLQGLVAALPAAITLYLVYWLALTAERFFGSLIRWFIPDAWYLPGLGIACGIGAVFLLGLLLNAWAVRQLFDFGERVMARIPLLKSVYLGVRDLMEFVSGQKPASEPQQVVAFEVGAGAHVIGLVTRRNLELSGMGDNNLVAVYFPMSYQVGGYTLYLPADRLKALDMGVEDAMRMILTGGMVREQPGTTVAPRSAEEKS